MAFLIFEPWQAEPVVGEGDVVRAGIRCAGSHGRPAGGDVVVVRGGHGSTSQLGLRISGAVLLAVSAGIHLDLYLTGYRKIPTIGWLFLLQVIVGFMLTIAALVTRSRLAAAASAALALSTLGAYLLAVWIGLFGFKEIRTRAGLAAGLIEVAAFATLALAAVTADSARRAAVPAVPAVPAASGGAFAGAFTGTFAGTAVGASAGAPADTGAFAGAGPGRRRARARAQSAVSMVVAAVSAVSVAALALLGVAVVSTGGSPVAAAGVGANLKTVKIGGVDVLANADGLTLYWFAPDTTTSSKCFGSCAIYWPPVSGSPAAGPGVTGKLGTIKRPGGGLQATYNGHPLYTYIGDRGPGQANGNDLDLNGGFWYDIRISR
jgi:predicted lipoprotein with Yx(FWY)xxD motif